MLSGFRTLGDTHHRPLRPEAHPAPGECAVVYCRYTHRRSSDRCKGGSLEIGRPPVARFHGRAVAVGPAPRSSLVSLRLESVSVPLCSQCAARAAGRAIR